MGAKEGIKMKEEITLHGRGKEKKFCPLTAILRIFSSMETFTKGGSLHHTHTHAHTHTHTQAHTPISTFITIAPAPIHSYSPYWTRWLHSGHLVTINS